jgi:hypothetical protein
LRAKRFKIGAKVSLFNEKTNERTELTVTASAIPGIRISLASKKSQTSTKLRKSSAIIVEIDKEKAPFRKASTAWRISKTARSLTR